MKSVALKGLIARPVRTLLTTLAIVLGVAMISGALTLTDTLRASTMIMLRLASPFLIYGLMFNVAVGLVNKLAPQIPVYFISTPFLLMGGLFLLYLSIAALIRQYADGFAPIFLSF